MEPVGEEISAWRGDLLIAQSANARLMYETRLAPVVYFPRSDVYYLDDSPAGHHTFCPFKGTAHYYTLDLPEESLTNALWAYPTPLKTCEDVHDLVTFMPGFVEYRPQVTDMAQKPDDGHIS